MNLMPFKSKKYIIFFPQQRSVHIPRSFHQLSEISDKSTYTQLFLLSNLHINHIRDIKLRTYYVPVHRRRPHRFCSLHLCFSIISTSSHLGTPRAPRGGTGAPERAATVTSIRSLSSPCERFASIRSPQHSFYRDFLS